MNYLCGITDEKRFVILYVRIRNSLLHGRKYNVANWCNLPTDLFFKVSISTRIFFTQKGLEYSHRNLDAIARFLVTAVRIFIGGLLSCLVSLSSHCPWANSPWGGKRPTCQSLAGGGYKSVVRSIGLAAWGLSCQMLLMFEADWPMKALPWPTCWARGSGQGGVLALNSLLMACWSLKHPLSCKALEQLGCMAKSSVSFWLWLVWFWSLLIRNQEESHLRRPMVPMGKSSVSWQYLL